MKTKVWGLLVGLSCLVSIFFWGKNAYAIIFLDEDHTFSISGQIQTRGTLRLEDSHGFTFPDTPAGHLVQHRNLVYFEFDHDLKKVKFPLDFKLKYHIVARFFYEGVYDYGPVEFQKVGGQPNPIRRTDDFKWNASVWEWYADISRGPFFFRIGRQNLSWGETDVFRLLDNINPLDNTFGSLFEDLNDRRIPLEMIRASYNFGKVGPISSFGVEGFLVPGVFDNTVSPTTPPGTPYAAPLPTPPLPLFEEKLDHRWDNSRYGLRLQGVLFENLNFSLAGYRTIWDDPGFHIVLPPFPLGIEVNHSVSKVWIWGGSMSFHEKHIDTIVRSEVAYIHDVPVFIPSINLATGDIPKKDFVRFSVGLDKNLWIRPLNEKSTFLLSFQYFGQYIKNYEKGISAPVPKFPNPMDYVSIKKYEQTLTFLMNTTYMNGNLTPELVIGYDPRGAWLLMPSIQYQFFDRFRAKVQYGGILGKFTGFGFLRDRDQISLTLSCLF